MRTALALALLTILTACGGGGAEPLTPQQYREQAAPVLEQLGGAIARAGTGSATRGELVAAFRDAADRLERLEPPAPAQASQRRLVRALRELADAVEGGGVREALRDSEAAKALVRAWDDLRARDLAR